MEFRRKKLQKEIIIVGTDTEENGFLRKDVNGILERHQALNYKVKVFFDSTTANDYLVNTTSKQVISLVIIDKDCPSVGAGIELIKEIKKNKNLTEAKIFLISGSFESVNFVFAKQHNITMQQKPILYHSLRVWITGSDKPK